MAGKWRSSRWVQAKQLTLEFRSAFSMLKKNFWEMIGMMYDLPCGAAASYCVVVCLLGSDCLIHGDDAAGVTIRC